MTGITKCRGKEIMPRLSKGVLAEDAQDAENSVFESAERYDILDDNERATVLSVAQNVGQGGIQQAKIVATDMINDGGKQAARARRATRASAVLNTMTTTFQTADALAEAALREAASGYETFDANVTVAGGPYPQENVDGRHRVARRLRRGGVPSERHQRAESIPARTNAQPARATSAAPWTPARVRPTSSRPGADARSTFMSTCQADAPCQPRADEGTSWIGNRTASGFRLHRGRRVVASPDLQTALANRDHDTLAEPRPGTLANISASVRFAKRQKHPQPTAVLLQRVVRWFRCA